MTTRSFVHCCYFCHFRLNPMVHVGENALGAVHYIARHTVLLLPPFAAGPIPDALIYLHFLAAFEFFSLGYRKGFIPPHEGLCSNNVSFQCCDHCLSQAHVCFVFLFLVWFLLFFFGLASLFAINGTWVMQRNSAAFIWGGKKKIDPLIFGSHCNPKHLQALWSLGWCSAHCFC